MTKATQADAAACISLSSYPLSGELRKRISQALGVTPAFLTLSELRRESLAAMLSRLLTLRAELLILPLEDVTSQALLPLLKSVAFFISAPRREVIGPELERQPFSRSGTLWSLLRFFWASLAGATAGLRNHLQLSRLMRSHRSIPRATTQINVLYLNANLWFGLKAGGSVGHISGVINAFLRLGAPVTFATVSGRLLVDERAEVVPLHAPGSFGVPFELNYHRFHRSTYRQLQRLDYYRNVNLVYQRLSIGNYSGVLLSRRWGVPLIVEYNGSEAWVAKNWGRPLLFNRLAERAEEAMLRHAHLVVTVSDVLRDELVKQRGVDPGRVVSYPNCIDPRTFSPDRFTLDMRQQMRVRLGIDRDAIVITFIGTFGQWHGAEKLADAIALLLRNRLDWLESRNVRFVFVGDGLKMPLVRSILAGPDAARFVRLTGLVPQADAPAYLAMSDILASPHVANADGSRFFGSPTKLFEYMAMGKAIVASNLEQIGEVLSPALKVAALPSRSPASTDPELALLTEPGSAEQIALGIEFLVEHPEWRTQLGDNARKEVLSRYTWQHHVAAILSGARRAGILPEPNAS